MPTLYFAYGSNMSARQMASRCPGARPLGVASLDNWQFVINTGGAAALRPMQGCQVFGVLWQCHDRHMSDLDRYEAVKAGVYFRDRHKVVVSPLGYQKPSIVYTATDQAFGPAPIPGYVEHAILPGAREFRLPKTYLAELETWLPGGAAYEDPAIRRRSTFRFGHKKARRFTGWGGQR